MPAPRGARAERPAQRETAHPARRPLEPLERRRRPGAAVAAALGEPRLAAAERVQVKRRGVPPPRRPSSTVVRPLQPQPDPCFGPRPGSCVLRCALRWPEPPSGSPLLQFSQQSREVSAEEEGSWCLHLVSHLVGGEGRPREPRLALSLGSRRLAAVKSATPLGHQLTALEGGSCRGREGMLCDYVLSCLQSS